MDGHEDTLEQLKAVGERLRTQATSISFLPGLLDAIDRVEKRSSSRPRRIGQRFAHLFTGGPAPRIARWHGAPRDQPRRRSTAAAGSRR